jgi:hypothetical protein
MVRTKNRSVPPQPDKGSPLFDPDPKKNALAWMQRSFPNAPPATTPEEAIHVWLSQGNGKGSRVHEGNSEKVNGDNREPVSQIAVGHGFAEQQRRDVPPETHARRSDDRLTDSLQHIAGMVSALLSDREQPKSEETPPRHPVHGHGRGQVEPACQLAFESTGSGWSRGEQPRKIEHSPAPGSWNAEPDAYPALLDTDSHDDRQENVEDSGPESERNGIRPMSHRIS